MKLNTVNVIVSESGIIQSLTAFPDTPEGNQQAESLFIKTIEEKSALNVDEFEPYLDDGHFEDNMGFEINIVHSTTN